MAKKWNVAIHRTQDDIFIVEAETAAEAEAKAMQDAHDQDWSWVDTSYEVLETNEGGL